MLRQIPIKKDYLLIAGLVLLLLLGYRLAFKKTADAWQLHRKLSSQIARANSQTVPSAYLVRKNSGLDRVIALYHADTVAFRSNVINTISAIAEANHVKLSSVPVQDAAYHSGRYMIQKLDFEGDYFGLLTTLHQLEQTKRIGKVRSIKFQVIKQRRIEKNVTKLFLEIYLEIT